MIQDEEQKDVSLRQAVGIIILSSKKWCKYNKLKKKMCKKYPQFARRNVPH